MFTQLAKLVTDNEVVGLTFSRPTGNTYRLVIRHLTDEKPAFRAVELEGTPEEFDAPDIDFGPIVEARKTIKESIAAAAEATKKDADSKPKPAAAPAAAPATTKRTPRPGHKSLVEAPNLPTLPNLGGDASVDPEAEAKRVEAEQKAKADLELAKKMAEQDEQRKKEKLAEIEALKAKLLAAQAETT